MMDIQKIGKVFAFSFLLCINASIYAATTAELDPETGVLFIPAVHVPNSSGGINVYNATLKLVASDSDANVFELQSASIISGFPGLHAAFDVSTGLISIPEVTVVPNTFLGSVKLQAIPQTNPFRFKATGVNLFSRELVNTRTTISGNSISITGETSSGDVIEYTGQKDNDGFSMNFKIR